MFRHFLFLRDEGNLQVSDQDDAVNVTDDTEDEPPEGENKPVEDVENATTDDSEDKPDGSEDQEDQSDDSDDYLDDEEEYVRQYNLPNEIKTTHDALEYLAEHRADNPDSERVKQIDEHLKKMGYVNGVDDLLRQGIKPEQPPQQTATQQTGQYITATDTINQKLVNGELTQEEAAILRPLAAQNDNMAQMLGQGLQYLFDELNTLKQGNETIAFRQSEADYRTFVRNAKKEKIRPLSKDELDGVMKKLPGLSTYHEAQMFVLLRDPNKLRHHLGMMRKNFEKGARKKLRSENKRFLKAKKRGDERYLKTYDDYYMPGGEGDMSPEFWKLPDAEQNRIIDSKLKKG